jgi:hypothetical protein
MAAPSVAQAAASASNLVWFMGNPYYLVRVGKDEWLVHAC